MSLLAMATTALAASDSQRRLASAITTRDQGVLGRGAAGFALGELPWTEQSLDEDRAFLIAACDRAGSGADWHRLSYEPRSDWMRSAFARLSIMLRALREADVTEADELMGRLMPDEPYLLCDRHKVFLHREGCLICHDE